MLLLAAIAVPNFVPARFTSSGEPLEFHVRVIERNEAAPIPGAEVRIKLQTEVTDADGFCRLVQKFGAQGMVGHSGQCFLSGTLRVTAAGFHEWEYELASLFGPTHDYFNQGKQLFLVVALTE